MVYSRSHSYSRSRSCSHSHSRTCSKSHSPHSPKHDNVYLSPKRLQKSPLRTTSKHSFHTTRAVSPHNVRSSKKSSRKSKYTHTRSRSSSPVKDSRSNMKNTSSGRHSTVSKRKKSSKKSPNHYNFKVSDTSLFAELVKDRQMRELAMKRLTQKNIKPIDQNEIVEINDSDTEQQELLTTSVSIENKSEPKNVSTIISSGPDDMPKILENQIPSKMENIKNGNDHSLEPISLTPEPPIKDFSKPKLPLPPTYPGDNQISPNSEVKCSRRSIRDLPLPPGNFQNYLYYKYSVLNVLN